MKIGFIGFGNMAQALAAGFVRSRALEPDQIAACARDAEKLRRNTEPKGFKPLADAAAVVGFADVVIVAVKPYQVEEVLLPVKNLLTGKILVSVAAGFPFERFEAFLAPGTHHISTIPNTPVSVAAGIVICERQHSLTPDEWQAVEKLFGHVGLVIPVDTHLMGIAGTVSGCGPAFAAMFIEALADAGVKYGLPRAEAYRMASQMLAGTGKLQLETGAHPGTMKDAVCSPGGTTIRGVAELESRAFRGAIIGAVDAIEGK